MKIFLLGAMACLSFGCARGIFYRYEDPHYKIKTVNKAHPEYKFSPKTVFVATIDGKLPRGDPQFHQFSHYVYGALEQKGHLRTDDPRKANLLVLISYRHRGPYTISRNGLDVLKERQAPNFDDQNAWAAYEYFKKKRKIPDWQYRSINFRFSYDVYLTDLRIMAIEYPPEQSPRMAWESHSLLLGQEKEFFRGFQATVAGSYQGWGKSQGPQVEEFPKDDPRLAELREMVAIEVEYQKLAGIFPY